MGPDYSGVAFSLALFAVVGYRFANQFAQLGEQFDAIGSKRRWDEVEPAGAKVALTKFGVVCRLRRQTPQCEESTDSRTGGRLLKL